MRDGKGNAILDVLPEPELPDWGRWDEANPNPTGEELFDRIMRIDEMISGWHDQGEDAPLYLYFEIEERYDQIRKLGNKNEQRTNPQATG